MSSSLNMFERIIESIGSISITSLEAISHLHVGQILLKGFDRCLGVIENTTQWSLPYHEISPEENGKSFNEIKLVRPLPWIFFLPSLLILRGFRLVWNIGACILGYPEIQPSDIVRCLQRVRQRLRAIRLNAGKKIRKTRPAVRDTNLRINDAKRSLMKSIQLTLSSLSCFDASKVKSSPSPTRVRVYTNNISITPDEKSATESTAGAQQFDMKRKHTIISSDESDESDREPFYTKMERYAVLNSSEDEDFNPAEYSSSSTESEDEKVNTNELIAELKELAETDDNYEILKSFGAKFIRATEVEKQKVFAELQSLFLSKTANLQSDADVNGEAPLQLPDSFEFFSPRNDVSVGVDNAFYSPLSSSSPEPEDNDVVGPVIEDQKNESNNVTDEKKSTPRKLLSENGHKEENVNNPEGK
ncbi:uncharacterized protein Jabba isoform X2 [Chelonus insularis]|uniref:uncharacterized protein Jabba isoform X2 n=1 Tax=Chelonus insularis TaxID=460826 RepID=UPI001589D66B|nr:uncharacterized protein LOC118071575 isoform X2 [Chelonus insularis]